MKAQPHTPYVPTESQEQQTLMQWAAYQRGRWPELDLLYHIPNERKCSMAQGGRLKAEGVRRGVPDLCLPVARGGYHGLYIELKRTKGGRVTEEQSAWIAALSRQGYRATVCRGWDEAAKAIEKYLGGAHV